MTKELLIKLRDELIKTRWNITGLCGLVHYRLKKVTEEERYELLNYIRLHRPTRGKHFNQVQHEVNDGYYWPSGEKQPRIDWLNDKIKKFKS